MLLLSGFSMSAAPSQHIVDDNSILGMIGPRGVGREFTVNSSLAFSDVDKAIELPQVREGPTKLMSYQLVAQSLLINDEIDKAFNMVQQVPEPDREKVYQAIPTSWATTDAEGMLKSMDRFPSKEGRSLAAVLLLSTNQFSRALSEEQVEEAKKYLTEEHAKALEEGKAGVLQSIFQDFE